MKEWSQRPSEEAYLLNPAFGALLLVSAISTYVETAEREMEYPLAFLVLPVVLHKPTRDALPRAISTSLASWIEEHGDIILRFGDRAGSLVPFTKEALLFGTSRGIVHFTATGALGSAAVPPTMRRFSSDTSEEVRECLKRAGFVGRWFARSGSTSTVMALWGVAP